MTVLVMPSPSFMQMALEEARAAGGRGEVPVGCVIVRHGKVVVGASSGSVALLDDDRRMFETLKGDEAAGQPPESLRRFPAERGFCATAAVESGQPVFVSTFSDSQRTYWRSASVAADGGFASASVLPLLVKDSAIGVVTFHFTAPVHFDEDFKALLVSVAQHCSQAIDRARLYESAQRARMDAELANRSKDEFLSTVSHELRTPLTAVLGWAAMLRNGQVEASRLQRAVEAIYTNATRQTQLIDELLDISRIVAGRAVLDLQELDLSATLRGSVEAIMPTAVAKGVDLCIGPCPPVFVTADPRRLEQILLNLLANAVKFTPRDGRVTITMNMHDTSVDVDIADTGIGIAPQFLPHVFERFRQGEQSTARTAGGLGLGLFIARQLAEAQSGAIRAASDGPGSGATFSVSFPVVSTPMPRRRAWNDPGVDRDVRAGTAAHSLNGVRVLLVDDEADIRELMVATLEAAGAAVMAAGSADEALGVLKEREVDVLLADIAMPERDGYDLIRAVRATPSARVSKTPAAAVTACARDDERVRALSAGFQLHVPKPVEPDALVSAVASLVATANAGQA